MKILVLNCGSSSVKFQFLEMDTEDVLARSLVEKIGSTGALLRYKHGEAQEIREVTEVPNHEAAINLVLSTLMHPRDGVIGSLDAIDGITCPTPTGAFYVFPDVSAYFGRTTEGGAQIDSALSFAEALLDEAKVAVVPGEDFGGCGPRHVRFSFACSEDQINDGLDRVEAFLKALR